MSWLLRYWYGISTNTTPLINVILDGNNELSRELITQGVDPNVTDDEGQTPLMAAAFMGNKWFAEILIDAGSEVNQRNHSQQTALFYSLENDQEDVTRLLIEKGADVNVSNKDGQTPLFSAAKNNNKEVARLLIEKGADVNVSDKDGQTPLFNATTNNNEEVARLLIEKGADVNVSDIDGETPLFDAAANNNEEVARMLIEKGADVNACSKFGKNPLTIALEWGNEDTAMTLINTGADVNVCNNHGEIKSLHIALDYKRYRVAKKLFELNPTDMDVEDNNGGTAIFHLLGVYVDDILEEGDDIYYDIDEREELVRKVASSCNIDKRDNQGRTALSHAIERMNKDEELESLARIIIDAGANVNLADDKGQTPLFYALSPSAVRLLIDHGGDLTLRNNQQETALIHILAKKDYFQDDLYFDYDEGSHLCEQCVSAFLNYVDTTYVNARDMYGRTAMFSAATTIDDSTIFEVIAATLVRKGAVVDDTDNNAMSVLSYFVERHCCNSFKDNRNVSERLSFFIKNGIRNSAIFTSALSYLYAILPNYFHSSNTLNRRQIFPNAISVAYTYASHEVQCIDSLNALLDDERIPEAMDLMVMLGVNPNSADSYGNTALHYATLLPFHGVSQENVKKVLETLRNHGIRTNIRNQEKETPLHFCLSEQAWKLASEKDTWSGIMTVVEICEFLLHDGSLISETTASGKTVYHLIMELIQRGLSVNDGKIRDVICSSALKLLKLFSKTSGEQLNVLKKMDCKLNSPLHLWASLSLPTNQNYDDPLTEGLTFKVLLDTIFNYIWKPGMSPNPRNEEDQTPLHLCKTWTAAKLLINVEANTKTVDRERRPPLLNAAKLQVFKINPGHFFPDVGDDQKAFFEECVALHLDVWSSDSEGQSILTSALKSEEFKLASALIEVACEINQSILKHLMETICKDESTRATWKSLLIEKILKAPKSPSNNDLDGGLFHCCKNIKELHDQGQAFHWQEESGFKEPPTKKRRIDDLKDSSSTQFNLEAIDTTLSSVHVSIAKQLLLHGADNKMCMDLCKDFQELHSFLTKEFDLDSVTMIIPWTSYSKTHVGKLKRVSRKQNVGTIGTYWFHKEPIGGGSFGHVFAGINQNDGREVAIKKIHKLRLVRPEDKREIRNLTALADCQKVVSYIFFDDSDKDFVYTVLELMEGNLEDYFTSSSFDANQSELLCQDVVEGLAYLHQHKPKPILHRDLKPGNILYKLHPKLCLKIADFGLSSPLTTVGTTVLGTNVGTRCWIAPEVIRSTTCQHTRSSDVFACGLLLHFILSNQKHPFSPVDCSNKTIREREIETEYNMGYERMTMAGWYPALSPEATHLIKGMLQKDESQRPSAADSLQHPFFWSINKKMGFLSAVGNQYEFECPPDSKAASYHVTTAVEADLENNFSNIVRYAKWDDPNYKNVVKVVAEMKSPIVKVNKKGKTYTQNPRTYDSGSVVELVRFIRNAINHVSERSRPHDIQKLILESAVFLTEFPHLLIEVYKAVTTHGWDKREEIKNALASED